MYQVTMRRVLATIDAVEKQ